MSRSLGLSLAWGNDFFTRVDAFNKMVGAPAGLITIFRDWSIDLINQSQMDGITSRGALPMVTWESWDASGPDNQPAYSQQAIARGDHDAYIQKCAGQAKSYGKPFQIRFMPEMNGRWVGTWQEGTNGNGPSTFVPAWKHVVDIFRAAGVTNVQWVWAPNAGPTDKIAQYWPGSAYVDVIGMDGYNWGSADVWQSFTEVFGQTYAICAGLDPNKPMAVCETGCNQAGGDKAAWITKAYTDEIPNKFPRLTNILWFNLNKECDWRVESSPASLAAYQQVAQSEAWSGSGQPPSPPTPPTPPPTPPPPPPTALMPPTLSVKSKTKSSITMQWTAVNGATSYALQESKSSTFGSAYESQNTGLSHTATGLSPNTTYWFRVKAKSATGESAWSDPVSTTTPRR